MPVLFLILGATLATSMWQTHRIFLKAFRWEKRQIAVDNAAIKLGRGDRAVFNEIRTLNKILRGFEISHHSAHACRKSPKCKPVDELFEQLIETTRKIGFMSASFRWGESFASAQTEYEKTLSEYFKNLDSDFSNKRVAMLVIHGRSSDVPLRGERCQICHRDVYWEIDASKTRPFYYLKSLRFDQDVDFDLDRDVRRRPHMSAADEMRKPIEVYVKIHGRTLLPAFVDTPEQWNYTLSVDAPGDGGL